MKAQRRFRAFPIRIALPILLSVAVLFSLLPVSWVSSSLANATPIIARQNLATSGQAKPNDNQDEVVRVDTNLVAVPVSVMDRDGRYVTDLKKEDFQVFENGVEQEVAFFAPVEQPFTILFLLDVSGSMGYRIADLEHAANAFVGQLRPHDQLSALAFADFPWVLFKVTKVSELRKGIKLRQRSDQNSTMLYDAVDDALRRMKKIRGRKAIVLFSDGYGGGIFASAKRNLHDAEELGALIYTVQFDTYPAYFKTEEANNYMRDLAQKTGGRLFQVENISNLEQTFGQVADELRRQYSLGYYPKMKLEAGQRREIKVRVRLPNLAVRARDSYIVDKDRLKRK